MGTCCKDEGDEDAGMNAGSDDTEHSDADDATSKVLRDQNSFVLGQSSCFSCGQPHFLISRGWGLTRYLARSDLELLSAMFD